MAQTILSSVMGLKKDERLSLEARLPGNRNKLTTTYSWTNRFSTAFTTKRRNIHISSQILGCKGVSVVRGKPPLLIKVESFTVLLMLTMGPKVASQCYVECPFHFLQRHLGHV